MADGRDFMTVGELAEQVGKTPRAIRLYEEMGLLLPRGRTCGNYREYGPEALVRLRWICRLHDLGLELNAVKAFLDCLTGAQTAGEAMARVRAHYVSTLSRVDEQMERLRAMRAGLAESLAWLEGCTTCDGELTRLAAGCGSCARHEGATEPELIRGLKAQCHSHPVQIDGAAQEPK